MMTKDETLFGLYTALTYLEQYEKEGGDVPENAYNALEASLDMVMRLIAMDAETEHDRRLIS